MRTEFIVAGKTRWPEWLSAATTNEAACSGIFAHQIFISPFYLVQGFSLGDDDTHFRVDLPSYSFLETLSQVWSQRCVSQMILQPLTLTMKIDHPQQQVVRSGVRSLSLSELSGQLSSGKTCAWYFLAFCLFGFNPSGEVFQKTEA